MRVNFDASQLKLKEENIQNIEEILGDPCFFGYYLFCGLPKKLKNVEKLMQDDLFCYFFYRVVYNGLKYVSFVVYNNHDFQKFMVGYLNEMFGFEFIKVYNKSQNLDKAEALEEFTYTCGRYYICCLANPKVKRICIINSFSLYESTVDISNIEIAFREAFQLNIA